MSGEVRQHAGRTVPPLYARLRAWNHLYGGDVQIVKEAADAIETLERDLANCRLLLTRSRAETLRAENQIGRA